MHSEGMLDLQVNGFAGVDFNSGALTAEMLDHALEQMLRHGTTHCLPTIITATTDDLLTRFDALDAAVAESRLGPRMVPGYHLEGPFLNPAPGYAGCHPPQAMGAPDYGLAERLEARLRRPILLVTVAPELEGSADFIRMARRNGKVVAIGHSDVRPDAIGAAVKAGASLATHLGNGIAHQHHKFDNSLFAQLAADGICATFIADGIHIPPDALKIMLRVKGPSRSILVTDAVAAAASQPGRYTLGELEVVLGKDGAVRSPGENATLAGSALTLDRAVANLVAWGLAPLPEAVAMATANPRDALAPALRHTDFSFCDSRIDWREDGGIERVAFDGRMVVGGDRG